MKGATFLLILVAFLVSAAVRAEGFDVRYSRNLLASRVYLGGSKPPGKFNLPTGAFRVISERRLGQKNSNEVASRFLSQEQEDFEPGIRLGSRAMLYGTLGSPKPKGFQEGPLQRYAIEHTGHGKDAPQVGAGIKVRVQKDKLYALAEVRQLSAAKGSDPDPSSLGFFAGFGVDF